jgi:hypothetical protein
MVMSERKNHLKRPQLRRCGTCQKVGHNTSTCPTYISAKKPLITTKRKTSSKIEPQPKTTASAPKNTPLRFFVHHVNSEPPRSPHLLDLKKEQNSIWKNVETITPEHLNESATTYYTYHQSKKITPYLPTPESFPLQKSTHRNLLTLLQSVFFKKNTSNTTLSQSKKEPTAHINFVSSAPSLTASSTLKKPSFTTSVKNLFSTLKNSLSKSSFKNSTITKKLEASKKTFSFSYFMSRYVITRPVGVAMSVFLIVALIMPGPAQSYYRNLQETKTTIADNSTAGFMALQESTAAILQANLPQAEASTVQALSNFNTALTTLQTQHRMLQNIITSIPVLKNEVTSRQNLIEAGQKITLGNTYLLKGISENSTASTTLTEQLNHIMIHLKAAIPNYEAALEDLNNVKPEYVPTQYQESFKDFKTLFSAAVTDFKNLNNLGSTLQEIFGGNGLRRYILVFQNSDELRPTGGFMGSFAEIDIKDGKIIKMELPAGGSYDLQGQLNEFIEPPTPLLMTNKRWEFQDANWFPDFPASAEKILWFYRHAGRGSVDGVIAINSSVLTRLLSIMGPITDEKRQITLDAASAIPTLQTVVEEGPEKIQNKPKQILSDLAPQFIEYLKQLQPAQLMPVLVNLKDALDQKEIQAYFIDQPSQEHVKSFGWSGQILPTTNQQDYLMVVNTNIQGQKSDAKIKQTIHHQALVQDDGSVIDHVFITREHTGIKGEKFYGAANISYLRVYVPQDSELIEAAGFQWPAEPNFRAPDSWAKKDPSLSFASAETKIDPISGTYITPEFGKTSFGNWVITEPGETTQIHLAYKLPFKVFNSDTKPTTTLNKWLSLFSNPTSLSTYQLVVQRQSGSISSWKNEIIFPATWQPIWKDGEELELASNGAHSTLDNLFHDTILSLAMTQGK